jgi:multidrug resistance protein
MSSPSSDSASEKHNSVVTPVLPTPDCEASPDTTIEDGNVSNGHLFKQDKSDQLLDDTPDPTYKVTLSDSDNPQHIASIRRWIAVGVISSGAMCVTYASSVGAFTEAGIENDFHVSNTVAILTISLYVMGLGLGPLRVGPLSEVYGRNIIYRMSYLLFFALSWPVAFAPNIYVFLVFRFLTGFCGAAFLSVSGGSVSDLFPKDKVASPMALYTICPFLGPVLGPVIGGFMIQRVNWRWIYYVVIIWSFAQTIALVIVCARYSHNVFLNLILHFIVRT